MANAITNKQELRQMMIKRRNALGSEQRAKWSDQASSLAINWLEQQQADTFAVYASFRSELDLTTLIEWGWRTQRRVLYPLCDVDDRSLTWYAVSGHEQLRTGAYGITEPDPGQAVAISAEEWPPYVFVPGLAFDQLGGRLGYGGGYYDRFAAAVSSRQICWIGTAFAAQLLKHVPMEPHDLHIDVLLTEQQLFFIH